MPPLEWQHELTPVMLTLGLLTTAALLAGVVGQRVRLPKVTSYLLMGVTLGPSVLNWIPHQAPYDHIEAIEPLTQLAIALVLFNLGCAFPLAKMRQIARRVLRLSLGELAVTFVLVTGGLLAIGTGLSTALLLGALALATAPATTILVLKEAESEGPITQYTNALVATNNLVSIVAFEILFLVTLCLHGQLDQSPLMAVGQLVQDLAGSAVLGIVAGLATSFCFGLVAERRRLVLLVGLITLVLGVCLVIDVPYLLTFLAMGVTVANSSYHTRQVVAELDRMTGLLAVIFFVTHGAELRVEKLWEAGMVGLAYIALRSGGKYLGIRWAAQAGHEEPEVRTWLGTTLVAQAGAAIALSALAVERTEHLTGAVPDMFHDIKTIILGTVVVFEIAGPLLIRHAVVQAGEVPIAEAIRRPSKEGLWEQIRTIINGLLMAFGFDPWHKRTEQDLTINEIMRKNVLAVPLSATFDDVIELLEHSRDNTFPVVDSAGTLAGVIRYRELSHALFDRTLGGLVLAADVTTPAGRMLHPDEPVSRASALFAASKDDCIAVVTNEAPQHLLGVVRRRDVLRFQVRERGKGGNSQVGP